MPAQYAKWDSGKAGPQLTFSNGYLTVKHDTGIPYHRGCMSDIYMDAGLHYWEITIDDYAYVIMAGVAKIGYDYDNNFLGEDAHSWGYRQDGTWWNNDSGTSTGISSYTTGDVLMFAADFSGANILIWIGVNGTWAKSGDPVAGTGYVDSIATGTTLYLGASLRYDSTVHADEITLNSGGSAFSYTVPTGFNSGVYGLQAEITQAIGLGDAVDEHSHIQETEAVGFADAVDANFLKTEDVPEDAVWLRDAIDWEEAEGAAVQVDELALGDSVDAINYGQWMNLYRDLCIRTFHCYLDDLEIPLSSFQCRLRADSPSFLSVVTKASDLYAEVEARANGLLRVYQTMAAAGATPITELVAEVDLESVRVDEGPRSASISLSGHKTHSYGSKAVTYEKVSYKSISDGLITIRVPELDPFLRPGDTVIWDDGSSSMVAGLISMYFAADSLTMQIQEQ